MFCKTVVAGMIWRYRIVGWRVLVSGIDIVDSEIEIGCQALEVEFFRAVCSVW